MTLGEFKEWTKNLPDDTLLVYPSYYKGRRLSDYSIDRCWIYDRNEKVAIVIAPDDDYDE